MKVYMFHYVMKRFNYFHFEYNMFEDCIRKLKREYKIIGLDEIRYINKNLDKYVILTFDDGTKDHYEFVYPILKKYNVKGVFFVSSNIFENKILDIHLIHQLIAKIGINKIYNDVQELVKKERISINATDFISETNDDYKMKYVKQLLQFILPNEIKELFLNELVYKYNISKKMSDYYLTKNEVMEMKNYGMDFGLHTKNHKRLELLSKKEQKDEILQNLNILDANNILPKTKAIAYPFGSYNKETLEILKVLKIDFGFSINRNLGINRSFEIQRIDCNILKNVKKKI